MSGATALQSSRKRVRKEARKPIDIFERTVAQVLTNDAKTVQKNPTRYIPDVAGFSPLSKNEVKKDLKDAEKQSSMMSLPDPQDDDDTFSNIQRSIRPSCLPESTILVKKKRFMDWLHNPSEVQRELQYWNDLQSKSKQKYEALQIDKVRWKETFESTRSILTQQHRTVIESNIALRKMVNNFRLLCERECGYHASGVSDKPSDSNFPARRRKTLMPMREILDELYNRQLLLEERFDEYENFVLEGKLQESKSKSKQIEMIRSNSSKDSVTSLSSYDLNHVGDGDNHQIRSWPILSITIDDPNPTTKPIETCTTLSGSSIKDELNVGTLIEANPSNTNTTESKPNSHRQLDLYQIFSALDESIRLNELNLKDFNFIFAPDVEEILNEFHKKDHNIIKKDALRWTELLSNLLDIGYGSRSQQHSMIHTISNRKKKRGPDKILMEAPVRSYTPYGVPLLLSSLSRLDSRVIGMMTGSPSSLPTPQQYYKELPKKFLRCEDAVNERCLCQSALAQANLKLRKLSQNEQELVKQLSESQASLRKAEGIFQQTLTDDIIERKYISQDLQRYGLTPSNGTSLASSSDMQPSPFLRKMDDDHNSKPGQSHHLMNNSGKVNGKHGKKNASNNGKSTKGHLNHNRLNGTAHPIAGTESVEATHPIEITTEHSHSNRSTFKAAHTASPSNPSKRNRYSSEGMSLSQKTSTESSSSAGSESSQGNVASPVTTNSTKNETFHLPITNGTNHKLNNRSNARGKTDLIGCTPQFSSKNSENIFVHQ